MTYELETLVAHLREQPGSTSAVNKLRKSGRTPAVICSLPGNANIAIELESRDVARQLQRHGRLGLASRVYNVELRDGQGQALETHRVLVRQVHINAVSDIVENLGLMHCPPERRVMVPVPVSIIGEDVSPGVRRGGFINRIMRQVPCSCPGDAIPPRFTLNVSKMDIGERIGIEQLPLPPGVEVVVPDRSHPVIKIGGRARREA